MQSKWERAGAYLGMTDDDDPVFSSVFAGGSYSSVKGRTGALGGVSEVSLNDTLQKIDEEA